jgi:alpha/beta superfamily hydrolase
MTESLRIESTDGLTLEAELDQPDEARAGLVLCHPHPKMGGTMNAPLLLALRDELVARAWAVLRFNFRGIEESEGEASLGIEEVSDAQGAVQKLRALLPDAPVAIAGWSFGGAVAVRTTATDPDIAGCVAIAPAVNERPGTTAGLPGPEEFDLDVPVLFVCGANDDLVSPAHVKEWVEAIPNGNYVEVPAANHFFWAKYDRLATIVSEFLDSLI